jgi:hypothetical protein
MQDQQTGMAGFEGSAPEVRVEPNKWLAEREKYQKMWAHPEYRVVAPGEGIASKFLEVARPKQGSEVIDFGSGTGRGALMLALLGGLQVHMLDFAENCLDEDVRNALTTQAHVLKFTQHDLNKPVPFTAEYGYCTDVLEHIPPDFMHAVIVHILRAAKHVFFQISCVDDVCGALIGEPLHLSVHPYQWWHDLFAKYGCVMHWSVDNGDSCMFYLSAWITGKDMVEVGVLNTTEEFVQSNVKANIEDDWQQVSPHVTNDQEMMILGNGPSLARSLPDIRRLKAQGVKIVTLNGAYHFAREHSLLPVNQFVVDAREFNARFTHPVEPYCNYFISSQCHPSVLEGLPKDRTWLWHTLNSSLKSLLDNRYEVWWGIPGGSTVLLRAIPLLRMLGFRKFHLFGCDSCLDPDGSHHTIAQPENNTEVTMPVIMNGKHFECHASHFSQAEEFMDLIKVFGNEIELEIYGNGLLAAILHQGASESDGSLTPNAEAQFAL